MSKSKKYRFPLTKKKIDAFCKKHHIMYLALFGSVLTTQFSDASDVDVLVKFDQKHVPHLLSFIEMESELSSIMGYPVDLKTPNDLSPYFRDDVLNQAKLIYGE